MEARQIKILWIADDGQDPSTALCLQAVLRVPYEVTTASFSRLHVGMVACADLLVAELPQRCDSALERFLADTSRRLPVLVIGSDHANGTAPDSPGLHHAKDMAGAEPILRAIAHTLARESTLQSTDADLHRRFKEVSLLHAVAVAGAEASSVGHLVNHALQLIGRSLFPQMKMAVGLLDERAERVDVQVFHAGHHSAYRLPANQGLTARVLSTGESVKLPVIAPPPPFCDLNPDARAALYMPLGTREGTLGIIFLECPEPCEFEEEVERVLATIALQLASAIEKRRLFEEIQQMAITDSLTGLFNRRHFFELARREFARTRRYSRPLSVLMMDIDHFKAINDCHGHPVGDEALCIFAERLRGNIRTSDIVGRYGGEEFILLLPETPFSPALKVAERIRHSMGDVPFATQPGGLNLTVSIGLSSYMPGTTGLDVLINEADTALLDAKRKGRNRVVLHPRLVKLMEARAAEAGSVEQSTAPALKDA